MVSKKGTGVLRVVPLGGLGEIGLNCLLIEYNGYAIAVDCGVMFPELHMPGIDLVIPDLTYLQQFGERFLGFVITHGHEDHLGALPYILTGLRLGLAQAWRVLVAIEMLAAVPWGLGWMIFGAREFLNTDVMMAGITVIAIIGLVLEKLVFQKIEDYTVVRVSSCSGP